MGLHIVGLIRARYLRIKTKHLMSILDTLVKSLVFYRTILEHGSNLLRATY